ncbi:MAG: iron-sulfur cluster assembly accessory protein, partial [Alkalinema sp. FL-bin-369]|nr:iron-sulfur cluster assembly accessory protein [Leptolyngbyaceae cyanobacterium LF-bin-369]
MIAVQDAPAQAPQHGILMSETALTQVKMLRDQQGSDLCLRVGVRGGGCSGMSYTMDFEQLANVRSDD